MSYKHLFFDWDHTLWDFEKNSEHSLRKLFKDLDLAGLGIPSFEDFYPLYLVINEQKWELYRKGEIDKASARSTGAMPMRCAPFHFRFQIDAW